MKILKKSCLLLFFTLLLFSIYKDITIDKQPNLYTTNEKSPLTDFHVIKRQMKTGETILSIVEEIHDGEMPQSLDIKQIVIDFKMINPDTNPYDLKVGEFYLFPVYNP
ncbi:hypothetical protein HNQ35_000709 [Cerasibacillus quisquiliarum]|uniref:LysM domain-containing protein n=1 Tax=Cerasibacillus quisquiliarum TaxID=227865 RepID=A0A511UZB3_9BACI|nr:hypothetical protein [Cerasibacillus quisquiliarum]MBB5145517.1 hypothetical protein [Cerasibacillus quisquiliarum]GEN31088.1 hypothetical protein CQU01_13260 [Cerasibacillus quisquiliarum]